MHFGIDVRLPYYQLGGISRYILQLLPALAAIDRTNHYTVFQSRKDPLHYVPAASNFRRQNLWTPCHHHFERWTLGLELFTHRLDVLHSPDFIPPIGVRRRIITVHDLNFLYYPQYLTEESQRYYVGQIRWAVRAAHHIAADSEHTRQDLINRLQVPPEKVTTVHLAADPIYTERFAPQEIAETLTVYNLPADFILFVGTLEPRKNIPTLLRAYARLRNETSIDVPLVLVGGKGWLFEEIFQTIEQLNLGQHVRHLPHVGDRQLAHLYHTAGALVLPSHYEGFGLPTLEAMHCGCPVVASNRASLPEVVGEAGLLLEPDDVDAWTQALERVLCDNDLRARLISVGNARAQLFTWQKTATTMLRLYESV